MIANMLENTLVDPAVDIHQKFDELNALSTKLAYSTLSEELAEIIAMLMKVVTSRFSPDVYSVLQDVMSRKVLLQRKEKDKLDKLILQGMTVKSLGRESRPQKKLNLIEENILDPQKNEEDAFEQKKTSWLLLLLWLLLLPTENKPLITRKRDVNSRMAAVPLHIISQLTDMKIHVAEENTEQQIIKFLRSFSDTENDEHVRVLATRIISKIEKLMAPKAQKLSKFTLRES